MALKYIWADCFPAFLALSTDMIVLLVQLLAQVLLKTVYMTDTGDWYIIKADLL